jgi:hypothetical protein
MTERPTHEEREALIAGDRIDALTAAERDDLALFADLLADPSTWAEPGAGLEDSIVQAIAVADPVRDQGATSAANVTAISTRRSSTNRSWTRRRVFASVIAAAAAIVIVAGAFAVVRRDPHAAFKTKLSATALAPGAHASADMYRNRAGFHVELDAHGLPLLPSGEYYQAWLKNAANTLVPIGTFSSSDGKVTLWSGVSPRDFPTMTVTVEATDNDQASSGKRVLVGPVLAN